MKILWIVNVLLSDLSKELYGKTSNGVWMDALLDDFKNKKEHELIVATTLKTDKTIKIEKDGVVFYALPDTVPLLYNENKKKNVSAWKELLETEKPDLIQVWGTEFTHGLCALRQATNIPSVIYMQGYLGSIARYYLAAIPIKEIKKTITLKDLIKRSGILSEQKKYLASSKKEAEMLRLSGRIISENEWCNLNVKAVVPNLKTYECPLSINKVFKAYNWDINSAEPHSVICTASGYSIKGLHMLMYAIALLKNKYPDIKLYVPGTPQISGNTFRSKLLKSGYTKYIEKLIKKLNIKDNIVWLGVITQDELAKNYSNKRVFVMPSAIENHSSSLKEAMLVGMPCISSYVGGIPEYVKHGENGLLYRYEEYEMLAGFIEKIFEDDVLAERLSNNAKTSISTLHDNLDLYNKIMNIYYEIINE